MCNVLCNGLFNVFCHVLCNPLCFKIRYIFIVTKYIADRLDVVV